MEGCDVEFNNVARSVAAHGDMIEIDEGPPQMHPTMAGQHPKHVEPTPMDTTLADQHPKHVEPTPMDTTLADQHPKHAEPEPMDPTLADQFPRPNQWILLWLISIPNMLGPLQRILLWPVRTWMLNSSMMLR